MQLNVGVLLVKANGQVALPHSLCAPGGMGDAAADAVSCLDKLNSFFLLSTIPSKLSINLSIS